MFIHTLSCECQNLTIHAPNPFLLPVLKLDLGLSKTVWFIRCMLLWCSKKFIVSLTFYSVLKRFFSVWVHILLYQPRQGLMFVCFFFPHPLVYHGNYEDEILIPPIVNKKILNFIHLCNQNEEGFSLFLIS